MLYMEIMAVRSEIRTKHTNTQYGQKVEIFFNVKPGSTQSNRSLERANFILIVY